MKQYLEMMKYVLENGEEREDRTGTGTISVFGYQARYDLRKGFPLITTKDMSNERWNGIVHELKWFLNGDCNIKYLLDNGVNIWNPDAFRWYRENGGDIDNMQDFIKEVKEDEEFADIHGYLGPIYGQQWRNWMYRDANGIARFIDQIQTVIHQIKKDPYSRRLIVSAWNPFELPFMALPPCHVLFQFYVNNNKELSCQLYQRSGDLFLGIPYNIASYSLLIHLIANVTGLKVGEFVHTVGDLHVYKNHVDKCYVQLERDPKPLPKLVIKRKLDSIDDFKVEDVELVGYEHHPKITASVSVGLK